MDQTKIARFGWLILKGTFAFLVFMFFFAAFFFTNYLHESGHVLFGLGNNLLQGKPSSFSITSHVAHPFFSFIQLPQQTKALTNPSLNFAIGGPVFSILVFLGLSWMGYRRSGRKFWFLLVLSILLFEVSGNIICGTDNFIGNRLSMCNLQLDIIIQYFAIFLFSGTLTYGVMSNEIFDKNLRRLFVRRL